jgi:hypothetical protein
MARAGQALVEYILVIAMVAVILLTSLLAFRHSLEGRVDDLDVGRAADCPPPGHGGTAPGHGGEPPGQCKSDGGI